MGPMVMGGGRATRQSGRSRSIAHRRGQARAEISRLVHRTGPPRATGSTLTSHSQAAATLLRAGRLLDQIGVSILYQIAPMFHGMRDGVARV